MAKKKQTKSPGNLKCIPLELITLGGNNPRQIDEKSASFKEFMESVRGPGVVIPVHVRTTGGLAGPFELLAGEKRFRAARALGLVRIPAINHGSISNEEAFEITFIENYQREDLTALEHGRAVAILLEKYKDDVAAVSAKLNQTEHWVRLHQCIHTNLIKDWRDSTSPGGPLEYYTAAHLGLIARFPAETQKTLLKQAVNGFGFFVLGDRISVKDLKQKVANLLRILAKAPFDAGPCAKCLKRSEAQPSLWTDSSSEAISKGDRCLDPACWEKKEVASVKKQLKDLREKYPNLVCISGEYFFNRDEGQRLRKRYGKILTKYDYDASVKKTDKDAVPALRVDGKGKGKIQYIKIDRTGSISRPTPRPKPLNELRAELEDKRWTQVVTSMRETISKMTFDRALAYGGAIIWMACYYGTEDGIRGRKHLDAFFKAFKEGGKEATAYPLRLIWEELCGYLELSAILDAKRESYFLAALFELDSTGEYKRVCSEPEFAEPPEWAGLKADGTPKKSKPAKAKKTKAKTGK